MWHGRRRRRRRKGGKEDRVWEWETEDSRFHAWKVRNIYTWKENWRNAWGKGEIAWGEVDIAWGIVCSRRGEEVDCVEGGRGDFVRWGGGGELME